MEEKRKRYRIPKEKHKGYRVSTGIISIIFGSLLLIAFSNNSTEIESISLGLPGLLALISGILQLNAKNNKSLYTTAGILLFVGAGLNFIAILDISIYSIYAVIIGIFDIIFSKE